MLRRGFELPSPYEELRRISNIMLHPDYEDSGFVNDISLLRMDRPVDFRLHEFHEFMLLELFDDKQRPFLKELGENPDSGMRIVDLKDLILKSSAYDEELVKNMLTNIIEERKAKELKKQRSEELDEERSFELEKLRMQTTHNEFLKTTESVASGTDVPQIEFKKLIPNFNPKETDIATFLNLFERQLKFFKSTKCPLGSVFIGCFAWSTLELRKVPRDQNNITSLNAHFSKFGNIVNIKVGLEDDPEAALVEFSNHSEALSAYRCTDAVLNNRFIKLFWHNKNRRQNSNLTMNPPCSDFIRPVCLPGPELPVERWEGQLCTVLGWGKLHEVGHTFPDTLQEVHLPVLGTDSCRRRTMFLPIYRITDNMFCAGYERGGRDACLHSKKKWVAAFKLRRISTEDEHRPGRPVESVTQENIDKIHVLVMLDRRMTFRRIEETFGIPKTTVDRIMREHLDFGKLSACWVPKTFDTRSKDSKEKVIFGQSCVI
ncbi:TMPRSS15 [Cordylochernes scorpioides]|uniref:TMPRSS15 n=1 Tax=Cordylochernes scorpioides TaxID=51811 RepID=A0ABY6K523_9ARAC|nr:TMPRSS15 [Cordylochernes scorpioides]